MPIGRGYCALLTLLLQKKRRFLSLWDKLVREFIIEELQIGKRGLPAELSKVIADLVL